MNVKAVVKEQAINRVYIEQNNMHASFYLENALNNLKDFSEEFNSFCDFFTNNDDKHWISVYNDRDIIQLFNNYKFLKLPDYLEVKKQRWLSKEKAIKL
jgi:hypothetical protein